ncbi:unnamed protein product [Chrysoparadoxa australica]
MSVPIKAQAAPNPYRLQPLVGHSILAGSTFDEPIAMHNPHNSTLNVKELYTTEGFFHLSLPSGKLISTMPDAELADGGGSWHIPPGDEREVVRLKFVGEVSGKYSGFLHIKTDREAMVLPVEVAVKSGRLQAMPSSVDFGLITKIREVRKLSVALTNTGEVRLSC